MMVLEMKVIGIIAEYNPFHNGHLYHIDTIKDLYPDSLIVLVLNGYFLQRGEISILTKKDKTTIALKEKVDLVAELPFIYGTQSADIFASTALKILENLQCDYLICGSESNDLVKIAKIAKYVIDNPTYDLEVKSHLKSGVNYPTALAKALNLKFTFLPNDLLAISYQKAIIKNKYKIKLKTIKRTNDYHDTMSNDTIISATNIRNKIKENTDITNYLPKISKDKIININNDKYFNLLKYKIITDNNLKDYVDVDEGIEYRLKKYINESNSLEELIKKVKTKRYTYNKLNRLFIHILIGLTKEDNINSTLDYIKVLGFNNKGKNYLKKIKKEVNIPLVKNNESLINTYEIKASLIYDLINNTNTFDFEIKNKPVIK